MATNILHFVSSQLSVGNALQNVMFYAMLAFFVCLIIAQLQTRHVPFKRRLLAK
jgi:hypothetical protein